MDRPPEPILEPVALSDYLHLRRLELFVAEYPWPGLVLEPYTAVHGTPITRRETDCAGWREAVESDSELHAETTQVVRRQRGGVNSSAAFISRRLAAGIALKISLFPMSFGVPDSVDNCGTCPVSLTKKHPPFAHVMSYP